MKYIKLFESLELKKYLVWKTQISDSFDRIKDVFQIFKVVAYDKLADGFDKKLQRVTIEMVYLYDLEKRQELYNSGGNVRDKRFTFPIEQLKGYVEFESDNLEDCYDQLQMILNADKYNL